MFAVEATNYRIAKYCRNLSHEITVQYWSGPLWVGTAQQQYLNNDLLVVQAVVVPTNPMASTSWSKSIDIDVLL